MINIQPLQISPLATKAKIHSFSGSFPVQDDSTIITIAFLSDADIVLKCEQVSLTAEEYNSWGEGEEGDNAILTLCLQKLQITTA